MSSRTEASQMRILFNGEFENVTCSAPTVFTGERLRGSLILSDAGPSFDAVQIVLRGKTKNILRRAGHYPYYIMKPLVLMACVKLPQDFLHNSGEEHPAATYRADFFFDIPNFIIVPAFQNYTQHQLPPSIHDTKEPSPTEPPEHRGGAVAGVCEVSYLIDAKMVRGENVVGLANREIIVVPAREAPPPLDAGELGKEYQLSATSSFGSFWNRRNRAVVTVESKEPRPVVFQRMRKEGEPVSTEITLDFSIRMPADGRLEGGLFEPTFNECQVTATLEAVTYFTLYENERAMSVAEIRRCPHAVLKRKRFRLQKRSLRLAGWKRVDDTASVSPQTIEWRATGTLEAFLPDNTPLLPSFSTTLVSRRYAFDLKVGLGSKAGITCKPVRLRVPVQMVYAPVGKCPGGPSEFNFEDELRAPGYVP